MPVLALVSAVFVIAFEQIVQWRYGATGIVGLLLLTIGIKAKSPPSAPPERCCWPSWSRVPRCDGDGQPASTSSELIVPHSASNHSRDCFTNTPSRRPPPCSKANSVDRMPSASYISSCSWSISCSRRPRV